MRNAQTLWELLAALTIVGTLAAIATPPAVQSRDRATARAAATTLRATLASARDVALAHASAALVVVDAALSTVTVVVDRDTVLRHALAGDLRARLTASRDTIRFGPTGRAFGASNTTLVIRAGVAAETVTVSRVGRVR
ncbi:MAG TPA: GspH/FimT family pseudopilin [Gemmatimonadaceae bacterium]|nr:GspH/FimT family pseudopilin [Gemmatimonadaceae bacterium]